MPSGLDRSGRPEAGFRISSRRLWHFSFRIKADYINNNFGLPAVHGPPDGFPASAGRVGRRLDFRFRAGCSGMLRS